MSDLQFLFVPLQCTMPLTLTIPSMDKIDESDKPAPDITSDQDSLIKKAFLEGRMRQVDLVRSNQASFRAKANSTDLPVHQKQEISCRFSWGLRCPTRRGPQTSRQALQRLSALLAKPRWLHPRDSGKS